MAQVIWIAISIIFVYISPSFGADSTPLAIPKTAPADQVPTLSTPPPAKTPPSKLPADIPPPKAAVGEQSMRIIYGSSAWNSTSTQPDSAFLFMRDRKTGKVVKIRLEESEPDSSIFSGTFAVSLAQGSGVDPEIFIPPRNLRDNIEATKKFNELLAEGSIKTKPLVVRTDENGLRVIDVYDTPEQSKKAEVAYAEQERVRKEQERQKRGLSKPVLKSQDQETAANAEHQKLLNTIALETAQREAERVRLEQIERQKTLEREQQNRSLSDRQRQERRNQANALAEKAMGHYQEGNFASAEEEFRKVVELDPENKSYYFKYGVSLYRNEKFNDALVVMKLSPDEPATVLEKKYYMALIHFRLKELDSAYRLMHDVGADRQSPLAPSAAFYEGILLFSMEKYSEAREPFERVIDLSKDPQLDAQAEKYLDQLQALIAQQNAMKKKWFFNGMLGGTYDSNVLLAPDGETSQGTSTKEDDLRLMAMGDVEYRIKYTPIHEWGLKTMGYYMVSSKDEVSQADPTLYSFSSPYAYKGMALGKGYKLALKPAYEMVYMDADVDGARENILNSMVIGADNTFVMRKNWFSTYTIEFRQDDSLTQDSVNENNADALKTSLKTAQTMILDNTGKRALVANAGYVLNNAQGANKYYDRYELGATVVQPTKWDASWNVGLSFYSLKYAKNSNNRSDRNVTFTTGLTKPVREWVSWNVSGSYSNNASNVSANAYSKYTLIASAIFNYSL